LNEKKYIDVALTCARDAAAAGCEQAEVFLVASSRLTVSVNGGQVESVLQANPIGLGLRVIKAARQGFVFSSDFRPESMEELARKAEFLAEKATPDEANGLPEEVGFAVSPDELRSYDPATAEADPGVAVSQALEMEKAAYAVDGRVKSTEICRYSSGEDLVVLADSAGRSLSFRGSSCAIVAGVVAQDDSGGMQSAVYYSSARSKSRMEPAEAVGAEAARRALSLLGASSVRTQRVPVVMGPDVAADWIANLFYSMDGEDVLKNTSFLSDKLDRGVGSPLVTIVDDALMPEGVGSSPFDAEGVPTRRNALVDAGICKSFVYNTYSARRAGVSSTGNATRGYDSPPGVGHHNLHLQAGESAPEEIIASVKNGLYVMSTGAFGFSGNTGDYSYEAAGRWITDGALASPVHEITIASNSLDMLSAIEMVGNDLRFRGSISSPTIKIGEMSVSGRS
jgi:PmbA protein